MKKPDPTERTLVVIMIRLIVLGWVTQGMQRRIDLLDTRVDNIEAARP